MPWRREGIGAAKVERYFLRRLQKHARQDHPPVCPKVLGIDEHFFTRKKGYATTFCDLKNHRIYDLALGRSEAALEACFITLEGKDQVRIVCMDLATVYLRFASKGVLLQNPRALNRFTILRVRTPERQFSSSAPCRAQAESSRHSVTFRIHLICKTSLGGGWRAGRLYEIERWIAAGKSIITTIKTTPLLTAVDTG